MDNDSVRTPTRSELNTFKVLSNLDFTNLGKSEPAGWSKKDLPADAETVVEKPRDDVETVVEPFEREEIRETIHQADDPERREPERHEAERQEVREAERHEVHEPERREHVDLDQDERREEKPRWDPETTAKARAEAENEIKIEKEGLLYELELMERQGQLKLHRALTMDNSLDEIQYQYDRANMIVSTQQTVDWAKTGIKMGSGMLEAVMKRFGVQIVDGFSNNLCKDMSKFNKPLTKMYRKYWRRGTSSPEMELAMIVFGALAMTVMGNKGLMGGKTPEPLARPVPPTSDSAPSALRPPFQPAAPTKQAMPEWARNALKETPKHYAQQSESSEPYATSFDRPSERPSERPSDRPTDRLAMERPSERLERPLERLLDRPLEKPVVELPKPEKNTDMFPELARPLQIPMNPVSEIETVKRLTLSPKSPRSIRRRREAAPQLNLD